MPSSELVMTKFGQMLAAAMAIPSEVCSALGSLLPVKEASFYPMAKILF